jgi:aldose 1-epimerase
VDGGAGIRVSDSPLASVRLLDEAAGLEATFVPGAGMICCSLRHSGDELLAQNAGLAAYAQQGRTMGIPLLYPWANRLAGFDYSVAGRTVVVPHDAARIAFDDNGLPIHGVIGGRLVWELTHPPDSEARALGARLSWSRAAAELFEVFPFRHDLHYGARLDGGRLVVEITVHACGADTVPVAFGFHPYLSLAGESRERWLIDLPPMRRLALDAKMIPSGPEQALPAQRFELARREFDDGFDALPEPARFGAGSADRRIELKLLEGYRCAQVFAPRTGSFICFEPMTAPTNALRSASGLRLLAPGERYSARFSLRAEKRS